MQTLRLLPVALALFSASPLARAQTQPVREVRETALDQMKRAAETEKAAALKAIADQANGDGTQFKVCEIARLRATVAYDQWFLDHFAEFEELERSYTEAAARAESQLAELNRQTVSTLAKKGQTKQVELNFQAILDYFRKFNTRYKNTPPAQRAELLELQNDPTMNPPLYVAHEQILEGMRMMTTNINATLKQRQEAYELSFVENVDGVDVQLRAKSATGEVVFTKSLLAGTVTANGPAAFDSASIWKYLSSKEARISGLPVNGIRRFFEMQRKLTGSCLNENWVEEYLSSNAAPFLPFSKIVELRKSGRSLTEIFAQANPNAPKRWDLVPVLLQAEGKLYYLGLSNGAIYWATTEKPAFQTVSVVNVITGPVPEFVVRNGIPALKYTDQFGNRLMVPITGGHEFW